MGSQESAVQALLSSQDTAVWLHACCSMSEVSVVQRLWSSQSASTSQQPEVSGKVQFPSGSLHVLTVQKWSSVQATGVPETHAPVMKLQVSTPLQAIPSSQWK